MIAVEAIDRHIQLNITWLVDHSKLVQFRWLSRLGAVKKLHQTFMGVGGILYVT